MKMLDEIQDEFETNGRLSRSSIEKLRELILGAEPFEAITVATDCGIYSLAASIAKNVDSEDSMVRWNSIGALLTRFRLPEYAEIGFEHVLTDSDEMVRDIALKGLGEVLPEVKDITLSNAIAHYLIKVFEDKSQDNIAKGAAYEGILAALDVLPLDRPPASKPLDMESVDTEKISLFKKRFLL